jgi:hypothetical protein
MSATYVPMLVTVPKRTNLFQEVVSVIYEHLAEGATKEESGYLTNSVTGKKREVDVILRTRTAGVELVIGVEATGLSEARRQASLQPEASLQPDPVDVGWVEEMIGKHKNLPTDKVVLVSETGFTPQARDLALAEKNMIPISPETLGNGDPAFGIVNAVRALWSKQVDITPWRARVGVERPGEGVKWFDASQDLDVYVTEGAGFDLGTLIMACVEGPGFTTRLIEEIGLANIAEDMETSLAFNTGPGWTLDFGPDGEPRSFYLGCDDGEKVELQRIDAIEITVKVQVHVDQQIPLHHRRLAEINVNYAFGEGSIGGTPALLVATEDEKGGKLSIRFNPGHKPSKSG